MFREEFINSKFDFDTPIYYYNIDLLRQTLGVLKKESEKYNYHVHYALKANYNRKILNIISSYGFGADCVSGNEVQRAVETGFDQESIAFAGVGKTDKEIRYALAQDIFSFNCESLQEIEVINQLAGEAGKIAPIFLRINPEMEAATHHYITTGKAENKFGIRMSEVPEIVESIKSLNHLNLIGLHFHIGSQINDLNVFKRLCGRVNEIQEHFTAAGLDLEHINVGGGLGIDYENPLQNPIPDFEGYFKTFHDHLELKPGQQLHFELGRSIVGQCGSLLGKVLYIKPGINTQFAIIDASMTNLIRPALYSAFHKIENITTNETEVLLYDVAGPVCESSDVFGKRVPLKKINRGDVIAIYSAGAYGEVMSSNYNLRDAARVIYSDELSMNHRAKQLSSQLDKVGVGVEV